MTRTALYARQSLSNAEGVDRQIVRCTSLADLRGWDIVDRFVDDGKSASKPRGPGTAWHRLLEDATAKRFDVVIAVDQDRLLRSIGDLVPLLATGVRVVTVDGEIDLTTADGEFRATMAAGLARFEVARKSERQRRANEFRRTRGLPANGRRAFGYTRVRPGAGGTTATRLDEHGREWPDFGHEPIVKEAEAIVRGYAMLFAGASLVAIARRWNADGLTTTDGQPWTAGAVRNVIASPRPAGLIAPPRDPAASSAGHVLDQPIDAFLPGSWEPIVSVDEWTAARVLLTVPGRRTGPGAPPKTLLSGIARCGVCGATVKGGRTKDGSDTYRCSESTHLSRKRDGVDELVAHLIIGRMSQPDVTALLHRSDAPDLHRTRDELRAAQEAETNLLNLVGKGLTTLARATSALRDVRQRIGELEASMQDVGKSTAARGLIEATEAAGADWSDRWAAAATFWEGMTIDERRAVTESLMTVTVHSPGKGSRPPRDLAGRLAHAEACTGIEWLA
ncbi:recombinase family protein [Agromyces sp. NPDC058064]|uniref:recombinase family protein n=1 Tax=Agromyces sp. NPDC058064 TaxID=3346322 RepID=UPI0036D8BC4C